MLQNRQDLAFFVDPSKFELYESLKRTDLRNLSFTLFVHLFLLDLLKPSFKRFYVG